jgi:hypothetical protein
MLAKSGASYVLWESICGGGMTIVVDIPKRSISSRVALMAPA